MKAINFIDAAGYVRRSEIAAPELTTRAPCARGVALPT